MVLSRSWCGFLIITLLMLIPSPRVRAQQEPNRAFLEAALVIRSFDQLSDQCKAGKGFTKKQSDAIAAWEAKQNVNALRTQLRSLSSTMQQQIEQGSANVTAELLKRFKTATPCEIAATIITTPKAKFTVSNSKPESLPDRNPNQITTTSSPSTTVRVSEIDSFGFVAIGGSASVAVWSTYNFSSEGRVMRGRGAGSSNAGVVTSSVAPSQRGRYQIDGLTLRMTYDDGSTEERLIIANPKDPKTAIWLDGSGYSKRG
jgi:hypothetical protein